MGFTQFARFNEPDRKTVHFSKLFLNSGGGDDMDVDGSVTPVDFTIGPPSGEIWFPSFVSIVIEDSGTIDPAEFGSLPTLTNGFKIIQKVNGTEHELVNIKKNFGLTFQFMSGNSFAGVGAGWLNTGNLFTGLHKVEPMMILDGLNGDEFIARVSDNLTGLNELHMGAIFWRNI